MRSSSTSADAVVGFAQFLLNGLHLLAQQKLALALVHLLLNLLVNLVAQFEHFLFLGKLADQVSSRLRTLNVSSSSWRTIVLSEGRVEATKSARRAGESMFITSVCRSSESCGERATTSRNSSCTLRSSAVNSASRSICQVRLHLHPGPHERLQADDFKHPDAVQTFQKRHHVPLGMRTIL